MGLPHQLRPVHDQERGSAQVDCERPLQPLRNRGEELRCGVGARERILTNPARQSVAESLHAAQWRLPMTSFGRKSITHLGALHGKGTLLVAEGRQLGHVTYEIDGYLDHGIKSANGQIEAEA